MGWLVEALWDAGRCEEAAAAGLEAVDYAARHGLATRWGTNATFYRTWALIDLGRWDAAAAALAQIQQDELTGERELAAELGLLNLAEMRGRLRGSGSAGASSAAVG